jgi:hypothetical protein
VEVNVCMKAFENVFKFIDGPYEWWIMVLLKSRYRESMCHGGGQHDRLLDDGLNSRSPNSGISLSRISCNVENNIPYFK